MEHGALAYHECVADDAPVGKRTSFPRSVKLKEDEVVVFAYIVANRKFKRPFRAVCWVGGGRASPVLGTDRTSVSGISASRGHAAALSAAMLR